jgi:hypothetical protein
VAAFPEQPGHGPLLDDELDATTKKRFASLRWRERDHIFLLSAERSG